MTRKQLLLLVSLLAVIAAYFLGGGGRLLSPAVFQAQFAQAPLPTALVFAAVFVLGTAMSLPVTGVMTVIAGMIFGTLVGAPLALLASTCGGTIAYLISRYLLHNLVQQRFPVQMQVLDKGVEKEGAFYLFCLRMVPVIPFWLLSLLCGVTQLGSYRFFFATLLGMFPVTLVLANFGAQLGAVQAFSMAEIFTPKLILSLTLLAALPLVARGIVALTRRFLAARRREITDS